MKGRAEYELRIVQMKLVEEEEKRKYQKEMMLLRHNLIMEELVFMAKNGITKFEPIKNTRDRGKK